MAVELKEGKIDFHLVAHDKEISRLASHNTESDDIHGQAEVAHFDPGEKLLEIFRKKGITPSKNFLINEGILKPETVGFRFSSKYKNSSKINKFKPSKSKRSRV